MRCLAGLGSLGPKMATFSKELVLEGTPFGEVLCVWVLCFQWLFKHKLHTMTPCPKTL